MSLQGVNVVTKERRIEQQCKDQTDQGLISSG